MPTSSRAPALLCARVALFASLGALPCAAVRFPFLNFPKRDNYGLRCMSFDEKSMQKHVTAIVSTSPRKEDGSGVGLQVLKDTINSIRDVLGFKEAQIVVAWDALPAGSKDGSGFTQNLPESTAANYSKKLREFKKWNEEALGGQVTIFQNQEWTHQAEMLHRVFEYLEANMTWTPLFYLAQDDSPVFGSIDVPLILRLLSCEPDVEYVRFLWSNDCTEGRAKNWNEPCEQHNRTEMLQSVGRMSDRPHFATANFYYDQIFRRCPRFYRGAPERKARGVHKAWLYGKRHEMLHDTNALVNSYNDQPGTYHAH